MMQGNMTRKVMLKFLRITEQTKTKIVTIVYKNYNMDH